MNISWEWLTELVDLNNITPEYLAERLTLASFEVESIIKNNNGDTILEISTTANRADTLSMIGIAREIAAILQRSFRSTSNHATLSVQHTQIQSNYTKCTNYLYTSIHNLTINESPRWLKDRLITQDIQPENNIKDILNFINLKWGQQFDIFDLNIIQHNASDNIQHNASDNIQHNLVSELLREPFIDRYNNSITKCSNDKIAIIKYNDTNIALAGITSSKHSDTNDHTKNILIQASICDGIYIKKISQTLNIETRASILQQKGINPADLLNGYSEALLLISHLCNGSPSITKYISKPQAIYKPIYLDKQDVVDILGATKIQNSSTQLSLNNMFKILNNLNLITYHFSNYLQINIPLSRISDIYRDIDIIEEITRIYGFDKFMDSIPMNHQNGIKKITHYNLVHIRSVLRSIGIHESMHSSLIAHHNNNLTIYNPLTEEFNNLKDNLIVGIIESYLYNKKQGNEEVELFETGRIFNPDSNLGQYKESIHLAGLISGISSTRPNWSQKPILLSWFQAKGDMEEFFERINMHITWQKMDKNWHLYKTIQRNFHPKNVAMLCYEKIPIGIFGEINFTFSEDNQIKIYGFEIIINKLPIKNNQIDAFKAYPKYPSIIRDINIQINHNTAYNTVLKKIDALNESLIESINLFDIYENEENKKNLGLRITYRSPKKTLTNAQVEIIETRIKESL